MPLPTHRTTASVLRIRRTDDAHIAPVRTRLNGSGKAVHDHPSTGLGSRSTPRLQPLPHPNELSRELGWVQGWGCGTMGATDHGYMDGWVRSGPKEAQCQAPGILPLECGASYQVLGGNEHNMV